MAHDERQRPWVCMKFFEGHRTRKRKFTPAESAEYRAHIHALFDKAMMVADQLREAHIRARDEATAHPGHWVRVTPFEPPTVKYLGRLPIFGDGDGS